MIATSNQLHRKLSFLAGLFIALVAGLRLCLRVINSFPVFGSNFWFLVYIVLPQLLNLGVGVMLIRGKRDTATGCMLALNGLYVCVISSLVVYLVNTSNDVLQLQIPFSVITVVSGLVYLLPALDCFLADKQSLRKFRVAFVILPVALFLGILINDSVFYMTHATFFEVSVRLRYLVYAWLNGLPGLATELISGVLIGLSFLLTPKK